MREEKQEEMPEKRAGKLAFCGRCVAVGSVLLLVPFVRRLREKRHERHHHLRFPLLGH